jgi:transposase-like protein
LRPGFYAWCNLASQIGYVGETCLRWWEQWSSHRRGEALREPTPEQAAAVYREALDLARPQGAPVTALFGVLSLARLYQSTGRP